MRLRAAALGLFLALAAAPSSARADAIPPAPEDCPRGQVGISSHSGAQCVPEAPKDCPVGWTGQVGGDCTLRPCAKDDQCPPDQACVEHAVCLQPYEDHFYEYGEEEREEHGLLEPPAWKLFQSPGLLAGPPLQKKPRPKPIYRYDAVNLCSKEIACAAPSTCQPEKLCVPRGSRALAYGGKNVGPMRTSRKTDTPLTTNGAEPTEALAVPSSSRAGGNGCAGCATASSEVEPWAFGAAVWACIALVRRRRDRRPR